MTLFKFIKIFSITAIFLFIFLFSSYGLVNAEEVFTWLDCIKEAAKNNPDLISAQEAIKESQASKAITASTLFPQIDSSLSASTTKTTSTKDSYSYGVTGTQLLFDGFKTLNNVKSASEDIKAAQQSYVFTSTLVRLNLRTAFINLLKAQELIQVAEEIANIRRDNLELITLRYESGLEHEGALLTAESDVAQAKFELSQARRNIELSQRQLAKEMGLKDFHPMYVEGGFTISDAVAEKPDFEHIVKNNPSLLQAAAEKNAAFLDIKSAHGSFLPELSGSAGADRASSKWPPSDEGWTAGLSLTFPLFEGGLRNSQVSRARAIYKQAEANERSTKDSVVVSLSQTWSQLQDAIETVGVVRKSLEAAMKRSEIAEAQYSTGFISFDNWTIIENNLVTAKKSFLNAQANMLLAEANWIQAKGETLEYE